MGNKANQKIKSYHNNFIVIIIFFFLLLIYFISILHLLSNTTLLHGHELPGLLKLTLHPPNGSLSAASLGGKLFEVSLSLGKGSFSLLSGLLGGLGGPLGLLDSSLEGNLGLPALECEKRKGKILKREVEANTKDPRKEKRRKRRRQ